MGGISTDGLLADAWRSDDEGQSWIELPRPPWQARWQACAVALPNCSVLLMAGEGAAANNAYTWLQPTDFEQLCSPEGTPVLKDWIASLDLRAHAVSFARALQRCIGGGNNASIVDNVGWQHVAWSPQGAGGEKDPPAAYSMQAAREGVPILPTLTMNHEHSKRYRGLKLDQQTQQAYLRSRREVERRGCRRYECMVCEVSHELRIGTSGSDHTAQPLVAAARCLDRKSTRLNSSH